MEVDPEILRAFADQVARASTSIREADVGQKVTTAADGLPTSTTQWVARLVGQYVKTSNDSIAANINELGVAVRGAGDSYEVQDTDLAGAFREVF